MVIKCALSNFVYVAIMTPSGADVVSYRSNSLWLPVLFVKIFILQSAMIKTLNEQVSDKIFKYFDINFLRVTFFK